MTDWLFTARERFTADDVGRWQDYIGWIGFEQARELVTLDHLLCPEVIDELQDADWDHNVQADNQVFWFRNVEYLRQRISLLDGRNQIIAMIKEPAVERPAPTGFTACGFDLLDEFDAISVLTNCGRFPGIIDPQAVNEWGLLPNLKLAQSIAKQIRAGNPNEPHCRNCRVWQLARLVEPDPATAA